MKTPITFVAVRDRRTIYKTIKIEHDFEVIPAMVFNGQTFPETSIERQVIDYLDSIDKTSLMEEHGFDLIIDYYPTKKRKFKQDEIREFLEFCTPFMQLHPELQVSFRAVVSECKDILFGCRKSHEKKLREVLSIIGVAHKVASSTMDMVLGMMKGNKQKRLNP